MVLRDLVKTIRRSGSQKAEKKEKTTTTSSKTPAIKDDDKTPVVVTTTTPAETIDITPPTSTNGVNGTTPSPPRKEETEEEIQAAIKADMSLDKDAWVEAKLSKMTLEEKAMMLSGVDVWRTFPVKRLGIPQLKVWSSIPLQM